MKIPKWSRVDTELGRRHLLGIAAAALAMLPFVRVGSHDPPWPVMAILYVGFILVQYLVFSPVLLLLLSFWRCLVHQFPRLDRELPYACSTLLVVAVLAGVVMSAMIALAIADYEVVRDGFSLVDAWAGVVLRPEEYLVMLAPSIAWAIVPRLVYGSIRSAQRVDVPNGESL